MSTLVYSIRTEPHHGKNLGTAPPRNDRSERCDLGLGTAVAFPTHFTASGDIKALDGSKHALLGKQGHQREQGGG